VNSDFAFTYDGEFYLNAFKPSLVPFATQIFGKKVWNYAPGPIKFGISEQTRLIA